MTLRQLLARLKNPRSRTTGRLATVGYNRRVYAIGDIHGRADLLLQIHDAILRDAEHAPPGTKLEIIYLGDYIDRGMNSKKVITILTRPPLKGMERFFLKGNHEALLLRFLEDVRAGPAWFAIGGAATAISYGLSPTRHADRTEFGRLQVELRQALPVAHIAFLRGLRLSYEIGDYFFVHAGVRPGIPLSRQRSEDMLWIRDDFLSYKKPLEKIVVHGHSISHEPEFRENRIGIDTGAYATNILSALVIDGSHYRLLSTA